jgi:ribose 5-phosphate isomerase B
MKIYFASDHAGFELKTTLVSFVRELGYECDDLGAHTYADDDDYPDYIAFAAARVSEGPADARAIILGGSGQGEAMVANKFRGVRAVVFNGQCYTPGTNGLPDEHEIVLSRHHNDANVLSLGARFLPAAEAEKAVRLWLETPFNGENRHARRLLKLRAIEEQNFK